MSCSKEKKDDEKRREEEGRRRKQKKKEEREREREEKKKTKKKDETEWDNGHHRGREGGLEKLGEVFCACVSRAFCAWRIMNVFISSLFSCPD